MKVQPLQAGLIGVLVVVVFSIVARLTFLGGSMFDPATAPGIGPFALGDVLAVGAFVAGYFFSTLRQRGQ